MKTDIAQIQRAFRMRWFDVLTSLLLALGGYLLLRLWPFPAVFPGEATRTVAELTGAWPRLHAFAPLWNALARAFCVREGPSETFQALQCLACLFVALSVGLFHNASLLFLLGSQTEHSDTSLTPLFCRIGAVASAVLYLALPPVWHAAQAPCAASLGLLLVAAATHLLFQLAGETAPRLAGPLLAVVAAAALLETPAALLLLPVGALFHFTIALGVEKVAIDPMEDDEEFPEPPEPPLSPLPPLSPPSPPSPQSPQSPELPPPPPTPAIVFLLQAALFFGILAVGAYLAVRGLHPNAALYRRSASLAATAVLVVRDLASHLSESLPTAGALAMAAFVLFPAVTVVAITRRSLSGDQRFTDSLIFLLVGILLIVQTSRLPALTIWSLLPSASFQSAFAFIAAFLLGPCVAAFFVQATAVWKARRENPEADGWEDPDRPGPFLYASLARALLVAGIFLAALPFAALQLGRETSTRAALRALDAYTHDLASAIGSCRYFVFDGWNALALRSIRPDVLPIPYLDSGERPAPTFPGDSAVRLSLLPDRYSRILLSNVAGWPRLLGDWLAYVPENAAQTAFQTGLPLWRNASRTVPGMSLALYGIAVHPSDGSIPPDTPDAEDWSRRLARLRPVHDDALDELLHTLRDRLDDFQKLDFSPGPPSSLPATEYLAVLPEPDPPDWPREGARQGITPALAADLFAIAQQAAADPSPPALKTAFDALLAKIRETDPELAPVARDRSEWQESELENPAPDPSARLLDLVHAYLLLRACRSPSAAEVILAPYAYNRTLDPAFWYLWGLLKTDQANAYGIMEAKEELGKFPEHAILSSLLDISIASSTADSRLELDSIRATLSDIPGDLTLLRRALRLQLRIGPPDRAEAMRLAAPHASRILQYDATDPLAHLVLALDRLAPESPGAAPDYATAAIHVQRAIPGLPEFTRPLFEPIAEYLLQGRDPPESALPTISELLDADRAASRRAKRDNADLYVHVAFILQHFDPEAINSRYIVDELINQ